MAKNEDTPKGPGGGPAYDVDSDIARLKRSGHVMAVILIVLLLAFVAVVALSLLGYFSTQFGAKVPLLVHAVYPVTDNVPLLAEPSHEAGVIGQIRKADPVFELQKIPGFVRVESRGLSGWVDSDAVKSKIDIMAGADAIKSRIDVRIAPRVRWEQKDLIVSATLTNRTALPVKNIRVATHFYDAKGDLLSTEAATVFPDKELAGDQEAAFELRGRDLLGKVATVSYEIVDFDAVAPPPAAVPPAEGTPPAAPQAPPATK